MEPGVAAMLGEKGLDGSGCWPAMLGLKVARVGVAPSSGAVDLVGVDSASGAVLGRGRADDGVMTSPR